MDRLKRLFARLRRKPPSADSEAIHRQVERDNEELWKKRIPPTPRR